MPEQEQEKGLNAAVVTVPDYLTGAMDDARASMSEIIDGLSAVMNMDYVRDGEDPSAGSAVASLRTITPPTQRNDQAGAANGSGSGDATDLRNVASGGAAEI
jgi:hypothetical protein